jgi:glycerol-3-phosphate dehydrogenase
MAAYDVLTLDRNRGVADPARRIRAGRTLSRDEVLARYPGLPSHGLSGAAVFYDGQMYNPPRLVLSFARSAAEGGAVVTNHVEARKLLREGSRVCGLEARDTLSDETLRVRAKVVLNTAGPQAEGIAESGLGRPLEPRTPWSRDACFVVGRAVVPGDHALTIPARSKDPGALLSRGERQLFLVPWHGSTLVGVWHKVHTGHPDEFCVSEAELAAWIDEVNGAYPGAALTLDEIRMVNAGLIPFGENDAEAGDLHFGHRSRLVDHRRDHQIEGLITLIGVRYTTGPEEAALAVDRVFDQLGRRAPRSQLDSTPVAGGHIDDFEALVARAEQERPDSLAPACVRPLVHCYGTVYPELFAAIRERPELGRNLGDTDTPAVSVVHAAREEMAQTLADVVLRRTDLGTAGVADEASLQGCAELLAVELGWDPPRVAQERTALESGIPAVLRSRAHGAIA